MEEKVEDHWDDPDWDKQVASLQIDYLRDLRQNNARNAWFLIGAIVFQIVGIAGVAIAAVLILVHTS